MAGGKKSSHSRKSSSTVSTGARKRRYEKSESSKAKGRHKYSSIPGVLVDKKPEVKAVDSSPSVVLPAGSLAFTLLNGIQEGSSFYNRIGRKIAMKSLHFTGNIAPGVNHTGSDRDYVRWMIIYDRQANGATPTPADLLTNYDNTGATLTGTPYLGLNLNNADRFVVLRDKRIALSQRQYSGALAPNPDTWYGANFQNYQSDLTINEFIDLKGLEVHYKASTNPAVIGDIATGALYFVCGVATATGVGAYEAIVNSRLRYWDI